MRRSLWAVLWVFLLWPGGAVRPVEASPAVAVSEVNPTIEIAPHAEYLLDPTDALRHEDILRGALPFQRHTPDSFQFSFKEGTLWIRCPIAPPPEDAAGLKSRGSILAFDNAALGSVTLYVPVVREGKPDTIVLRGGWQQGGDDQGMPFLYPSFFLPESLDGRRPVIIRVATPFLLQFRATLYTVEGFRETGFGLFLSVGFCAGILAAMLLYNLVLYLYVRDRRYLCYNLYVFFMLLWQCVLLGLARYFWPAVGAALMSYVTVLAALMMFFSIIFAIVFLDTARTAPRHDILLKGLAVCKLIIIALVFLQYPRIANLGAYLSGQAATILLFTAAVASLRSGYKPARYYLVAAGVFLLSGLIFLARFYGLIPNNTFTMHIMLFGSAAEAILLSFALGYRMRVMRERGKALEELSVTDELTGLFNRRFLNAMLVKKIAETSRGDTPLSLLMMDVDLFKGYNDAYGHPEGDKVLMVLGKVILQALRAEDIACRYGGEEFAAILHKADREAALEIAERIRTRFEQETFTPRTGRAVHMTVSISVGELLPGDSDDEILVRADQALYRAKKTGRNRVCFA